MQSFSLTAQIFQTRCLSILKIVQLGFYLERVVIGRLFEWLLYFLGGGLIFKGSNVQNFTQFFPISPSCCYLRNSTTFLTASPRESQPSFHKSTPPPPAPTSTSDNKLKLKTIMVNMNETLPTLHPCTTTIEYFTFYFVLLFAFPLVLMYVWFEILCKVMSLVLTCFGLSFCFCSHYQTYKINQNLGAKIKSQI